MAEQIPEVWQGEEVTVVHHGGRDGSQRHTGVLDSVNERGVAIKDAKKDRTHFFPWNSIIYIQHPARSRTAKAVRKPAGL